MLWVQRSWNQFLGDESDYDAVETGVLQPTTSRAQCKPVPVLKTSTVGCEEGDEILVETGASRGYILVRVSEHCEAEALNWLEKVVFVRMAWNSGQDEGEEENSGQRTEWGEIDRTGAIIEPGRLPFGRIECLIFDKQAILIKPERLFQLDQDLFGQPVAISLLYDQPAKESAPDQGDETQEDGLRCGEPAFDGTE